MAVDLGISLIELNDFIKNAFRRRKQVKKRNLQNKEMTTKTLKTFFENITEYPSIHEIQTQEINLTNIFVRILQVHADCLSKILFKRLTRSL